MRWFAIHTFSNFENKVAKLIGERAKQRGLSSLFEDIIVPKEKVIEMRGGRKINVERTFFPGYVLVKMEMTDEAYYLIKHTPKVVGFLGSDDKGRPKPMPLSEAEAQLMLQQVQEGIKLPKPVAPFEVGDEVRVLDGAFASFGGTVEEVDEGRSRVKVAVLITIKTPELRRLNIVAAMFGTFCKNESEARKFWAEVARGGVEYEDNHNAPAFLKA